tara:strand:- start:1440 stop:1958 length:519 start_codon:yes stop_codon:yes gene_type:complete
MKPFNSFFSPLIIYLILVSGGIKAQALLPISIESDLAERNEKTGITIYKGNVLITQGNLSIKADLVTITENAEQISKIHCAGSPASFKQLDITSQTPDLIGTADDVEYLLQEQQINLKKNASLSSYGTLITGDSINYDLKNEIWKAGGAENSKKRIRLFIPPKSVKTQNLLP